MTGQIAFHHPTTFGCTLAMCLAKFPSLTLAPHTVHVDQTPFEAGLMNSSMGSSTVKPLFLASSLTLNAVSFLTVMEYQPFSGIDLPLSLVHLSLTGQIHYKLARGQTAQGSACGVRAHGHASPSFEAQGEHELRAARAVYIGALIWVARSLPNTCT